VSDPSRPLVEDQPSPTQGDSVATRPAPTGPTGVRVGDVIADKYRVDRMIGAGGMGVVLAAHHLQLGQNVALKVLHADALGSFEVTVRFLREARTAARIKSDHVARVMDVGQLEAGSPYIVMEHLEGCDLFAWLERQGPLPIPQAIDFVLQTCEAIAEAHLLGVVHRDLKPANLFCTRRADGQLWIKVLDFGISKAMAPGDPGYGMTSTGAVMGSLFYMSPEQIQSAKKVDERTDIWSLGMTLFELLTGRAPFEAASVTDLTIKVMTEPATRLRAFRPDAPEALERVILRCLEKERPARFQTVADLAVALQPFAPDHARLSVERVVRTLRQREPHQAEPTADPALMPTLRADPEVAASSLQVRGVRGRTWAALGVVAVAALLLGTVAFGALLRRRGTVAAAPSAATAPSPPSLARGDSPSGSQEPPSTATAPSASQIRTTPPLPVATGPLGASPPTLAVPAPTPSPKRTRARPPGEAAASGCNPNFVFDEDGNKHFKPECFQK
jgi:serine/threonine protein kinase